MADTWIEWADKVWNPVRGCSPVSEGCRNCYAMRQAHRFSGPGQPYEGLTHAVPGKGPKWTGEVRCVPELLDAPLRWRKPQRVFVNSMSDLFHPNVPFEFTAAVWAVMGSCPQHTFIICTKRPSLALEWHLWMASANLGGAIGPRRKASLWHARYAGARTGGWLSDLPEWPLPNVWLGVSVEDQYTADRRIPLLLQTPAAVRFVSCEPLLGHVSTMVGGIDWVIVGGESGPGARPCNVGSVRSIVRQCREAGVPVFVKQLGAQPVVTEGSRDAHLWTPNGRNGLGTMDDCGGVHLRSRKGADAAEWPEDLRVREWPDPGA
jgi:protein gp37